MKILIVDDERDLCDAVCKIVERRGHHVHLGARRRSGCGDVRTRTARSCDPRCDDAGGERVRLVSRYSRDSIRRCPSSCFRRRAISWTKASGSPLVATITLRSPSTARSCSCVSRRGCGARGSTRTASQDAAVARWCAWATWRYVSRKTRCSYTASTRTLLPRSSRLSQFLANHLGEVFTAQSIIENVWGQAYMPESASIAVFVRKIRSKIEDDPSKRPPTCRRYGGRGTGWAKTA